MSATFYWWQFMFVQYATEISFIQVMNKMSYECLFYWWQFTICAVRSKNVLKTLIRCPTSTTFYWWRFTFVQYAAEIRSLKVIKMSYECPFLLVAVHYLQCAAEIRADALFLVHRLMLCVYWHEGSTARKKISCMLK